MTCGGCTSGGAHRRWCPAVVGEVSARRARMAEQVDALAYSCGVPEAVSYLWEAAYVLRVEADLLARAYARTTPPPETLATCRKEQR